MYNEPVSFKEATDQMAARFDTPTAMKYKEITAAWDAQFRRRAFFSARVAEADLLGELHRKAQAVADGRMTKAQARRLIREFFVGEGADALAALGFAPPKDAKGISQLASIPRLELIVDTNVRMAQETGHYKKWESLKDVYPYGVWRVGYSKVHREAHLERDGKIYAFDHPIWRESPPGGEFNCHCRRELMTARELAASGKMPVPENVPFQPSSLGFDPGADSWGNVPFGKTVTPSIKKEAEKLLEQDLTAEAKNLTLERMDERQAVIDELAQYVGQLETREDEMARGFVADAERQYDEMQSDIARLKVMGRGIRERRDILDKWAKQDEDAKASLVKEADNLNARKERAALERGLAERQKNELEGLTDEEKRNAEARLDDQIKTLAKQEDVISFYKANADWMLRNITDNMPSGVNLAKVRQEVRTANDWLNIDEAGLAATHEMILNTRRMVGTVAQLYRYEFRLIGRRPGLVMGNKDAFYMPREENIYLRNRYNEWGSFTATVTHEFGHWLDWHSRKDPTISSIIGTSVEQFINAGKEDVNNLMAGRSARENKERYGGNANGAGTYWWGDLSSALFNKTDNWTRTETYTITSYADSMQSLTAGRYGWGHQMAYARRQDAGVEAFAETYLAIIRKDEHFRIVYPRMWEYITGMLRTINQKWR